MHALSSRESPFEPVILEDPHPTTLGKRTLLVVDDDEGPRQALQVLFRGDYRVLLAESGLQALELAHLHPIDVVILDLRMPVMSGIEVLNHFKRIDPAIEVIILTAFETLETARQALRLGACDYLTKPSDIRTIRQAVAAAMERRAISSQVQTFQKQLSQLQAEIQNQKVQQELARARGDIYASIIHDINGPLTVISGFIGLINVSLAESYRVEGETLDRVKGHLERVTRQVNSCLQISRRYLSFLKGKAGDDPEVSVNQILRDLEELLRARPDTQSHHLSITPLAREISAKINGTDLIQILLNLVINGLQCSDRRHRVEVRGEFLGEPLPLSQIIDGPWDRLVNREGFRNQAPLVALSVRDDGPGIRPEHLDKIFEFCFTTKPAGQGTGLGLAIVKRLVEQAGGALHVLTETGRGSTFTIYLSARETAGHS